MKTTIFGAGAVGGHLAARLGAAGADIAAVCRGAQLAAIRERGITLHIHDERYSARIRATDRPEELGRQDLVIVTAKSSTLPEMAASIATLCGPDTTVVFAMNGVPWWYLYRAELKAPAPDLSRLDPEGALAGEIGHERVIGCMINSANAIIEPGVIRNSPMTKNKFTLGEPDGTLSQRVRAISAFLESFGLEVPITETIRTEIWDKFRAFGVGKRYAATDYARALAKMPAVVEEELKNGDPVERVSEAICRAIESPRPRARYPLTAMWYVGRWVPDRLLDRELTKRLHLR